MLNNVHSKSCAPAIVSFPCVDRDNVNNFLRVHKDLTESIVSNKPVWLGISSALKSISLGISNLETTSLERGYQDRLNCGFIPGSRRSYDGTRNKKMSKSKRQQEAWHQ